MIILTRIVGMIALILLLPLIMIVVVASFFVWLVSSLWEEGAELF